MPRPGRKPQDDSKLDVKLNFRTAADGRKVRELGGGPAILACVYEHMLGKPLEEQPIATVITQAGDHIEVTVRIPCKRLAKPRSRKP